jgi:S-adenosylmethionine:tRNA ribosyltransferase-isomerase
VKTSDFDYDLPSERIAQTPVDPRHASRLMVLNRRQDSIQHTSFWHIDEFLNPGDLLVINQTRVIPARLYAHKPTGGRVEVLLLHPQDELIWEVLVGGKRVTPGLRLQIENGPAGIILSDEGGSRRHIRFEEPIEPYLQRAGEMPLPPYIHTRLNDPERYQTVYASVPGSAAAPTAGLHFTPELMKRLEGKGIHLARVTLHVGLDTFAPVTEEQVHSHPIHTEWCDVNEQAAAQINTAVRCGGRIIAVGTTSVRTLETAAQHASSGNRVGTFQGATSLFITPGYNFKAVDALITNFHLPRSTLIMLVSAFAGRERILQAYRTAVEMEYRFYSFGDAMLIL